MGSNGKCREDGRLARSLVRWFTRTMDNTTSSRASRAETFSLPFLLFSSPFLLLPFFLPISRPTHRLKMCDDDDVATCRRPVPLHPTDSALIDLIRLINRLIGKESGGCHLGLGIILPSFRLFSLPRSSIIRRTNFVPPFKSPSLSRLIFFSKHKFFHSWRIIRPIHGIVHIYLSFLPIVAGCVTLTQSWIKVSSLDW